MEESLKLVLTDVYVKGSLDSLCGSLGMTTIKNMKKNVHKHVYLDYAATTPVDSLVLKAMMPYFSHSFTNPAALYQPSVKINEVLLNCRKSIAVNISALSNEIIFTSGGTESNNLAIFGAVKIPLGGVAQRGGLARTPYFTKEGAGGGLAHIITTPIEHHSVLEPIKILEKQGAKVTYLKVDSSGLVNPNDVIKAIRPETVLVAIMMANNEIGTVEPIAEIGRLLLKHKKTNNTEYPYFFTDACQAAGYLDINILKLHVDLLSVNAAKIYGPKGAGFLFVKRGTKLAPIFYGGQQEFSLRAGTENIPAIVGLAKALELVRDSRKQENQKARKLSEAFFNKIERIYPRAVLNGPPIGESRLPNNLNINFTGLDAETLSIYLDSFGVYCATGSACSTNTDDNSYVIKAINKSASEVKSSLRFSLGKATSIKDINYAVDALKKCIKLIT